MTTPAYLKLTPRGGASARLCALMNHAAYTKAPDVNLPPSMQCATWREARKETFLTLAPELSQGFNGHGRARRPVWTTFKENVFRDERYADEVDGGPDHRGWYADVDCSRKIRGIVARLTHGRFIAGYYSDDNGERVYFGKVYDDEKEAARAADQEAEQEAEAERDYDERWIEAQALADKIEQSETRVRELYALRNHHAFKATARDELRNVCAIIRERRDELRDDYPDINL